MPPDLSPGEWLTAQGRWVQDREFGLQFKAEMLTSTAPTTKAGIEKYLGSGMVKGIGPVYAKKLVATFGERIFDIIEQESARLEDVDGIGPKRRQRVGYPSMMPRFRSPRAIWPARRGRRELLGGAEDFCRFRNTSETQRRLRLFPT